jgi:hypothetical protein
LIKECSQHEESRAHLVQNLDLITQVIIRVVETADSWKNKKVSKTSQVVNLYLKAAKIIVKQSPENVEGLRTHGAQLLKAIEKECERDKALSNLKGKAKEIKNIINEA